MLSVIKNRAKSAVGILQNHVTLIQIANLTGRTTRGGALKLKPAFPYKDRRLTLLEAMMDITVKRVEEENARLIVVDGPVACGKTPLIKALAKEFDMIYFDQPTMDEMYITSQGFDLRTFDDQLPPIVRSYDCNNFLACPFDVRAGFFQMYMIQLRFSQYIEALAHILNAGQGVILERSVYSDYAFVEAMFHEGFISKKVRDSYVFVWEHMWPLIIRPHVIIYLDVPVSKVQERIRERNLSVEVNSPALTPSYLQKLEDVWKHDYLKKASEYSEVLVYNWSDGGDAELVIEDLEKLDLDPLKQEIGGKFGDWVTFRQDWRDRRLKYTNDKRFLMSLYQVPLYDVDELLVPADDLEKRAKLYNAAPGNEYNEGYNPKTTSMWKLLLGIKPQQRKGLSFAPSSRPEV